MKSDVTFIGYLSFMDPLDLRIATGGAYRCAGASMAAPAHSRSQTGPNPPLTSRTSRHITVFILLTPKLLLWAFLRKPGPIEIKVIRR